MPTGLALQPQRLVSTTAQAAKHDGNSVGMKNTHPGTATCCPPPFHGSGRMLGGGMPTQQPIMKSPTAAKSESLEHQRHLDKLDWNHWKGKKPCARSLVAFDVFRFLVGRSGGMLQPSHGTLDAEPRWRAIIRSDRSLPSVCNLPWRGYERAHFRPTTPKKRGKLLDGYTQLAHPCPMTSETRLLRLMYPTYSLPLNES